MKGCADFVVGFDVRGDFGFEFRTILKAPQRISAWRWWR
jgi:hypothetical protein